MENTKPTCDACPFFVKTEYRMEMYQESIYMASDVYCKLYDNGNTPCGAHTSIQSNSGITFYNDVRCNYWKVENSQDKQAL